MRDADRTAVARLYEEFDLDVIGKNFVELLEDEVVPKVVTRYPNVAIYNNRLPWDVDSQRDLVQEVVETQLLGANQLEFVFHEDGRFDPNTAGIRRRLTHVVNRTLFERRRRLGLIEDRLVERCRKIADSPPFMRVALAGQEYLLLDGVTASPREPRSDPELFKLANLDSVRSVPRLTDSGDSKQSMGYNSTHLKFVLNALLEEARIISTADLRRIFAEIFAALRPSTLLDLEDRMDNLYQDDHPRMAPDPMLERNLSELVEQLSADQRQILLGKFHRISDADLARALDLSRPTIQRYREQATERVQATVASLDDQERDAAYELLIRMIDERETADGDR